MTSSSTMASGKELRKGHLLLQVKYAWGPKFGSIMYQRGLDSCAELVRCCFYDPKHNRQRGTSQRLGVYESLYFQESLISDQSFVMLMVYGM